MPENLPPSRTRWILYGIVILVVAVGVWRFSQREERENGRRAGPNPAWAGTADSPAMPVRISRAERRDLPVHLKAIGTVTPLNTVTVRSRVDGQLLRIAFEEGARVKAGDLLAEIDPEPYRIRLAEVEGRQRQNQAQLETALADLERILQLHEKKLVTNQEMDAQRALVREREGAVASDAAAVANARLQLAYTRIEAPISGRLGLRRIDPGNLIRANDADGIVTITQTQPITVMFTVPEVDLPRVIEPLRAGEQLPVEAWDRGERNLLATGTLSTVDNQIDLATGTLRLRATFANDDESLFPNQFVNTRMRVRVIAGAIVIPAAAVQFGAQGTYVFVVTPDNKASLREVALGASDGVMQAVERGLEPGDPVVLEGIDRLREGRDVVVVGNQPAAAAAP